MQVNVLNYLVCRCWPMMRMDAFQGSSLQIDTRNRDHGVTRDDIGKCTNMTECRGYEPRQARFGRNWGGVYEPPAHDPRVPQGYSGILEVRQSNHAIIV